MSQFICRWWWPIGLVLSVVLGIVLILLDGCQADGLQFTSVGSTYGDDDTLSTWECPLEEMVFLPGFGGPFIWGAPWGEPQLGDAYNWMLEAEYSEVSDLCVMAAPFPGREGFPYFESSDPDDAHGFSYGDMESVQGSQVLAELGLRLMDFRQAAWLQKSIEGEVNLDFCGSDSPNGMLTHDECMTSLGIEIGLYAFWTFYDDEARAAHGASILALTGDSGQEAFVGLPHEALGFLITGWGGGAVCGSRTPYCIHQHVVEYRALWDGPMSLGLEVDPNDPFQTWPGSYWRDDLVLLVTEPRSPDTERQARYDELVGRYEASNYNKAVLWDPSVGL